ncbi:DUF7109 family protein [Halobacterium zhouii]|uniref:DUF7109 family protein n=1 Tax=Halobacterium zhouii TaxID=2902624 RepID=UPI001E2FD0A8|nr:hypothetical protein [Halobacterium zhouii]
MDGDELAGIVDLFGGLTRSELERALDELAFKRGDEPDDPGEGVDAALHEYYLVEVEYEDATLLAPGPVAFPELPEYGPDLPHILDVERRDVDREVLAAAVRERLESEVAEADGDRAEYLLDVTYDAEAWAPLDLDDVREDLAVDS